MKTLQDVMKEHPIAVTQNTGVHVGTNDTLTRWYNMWWGALTDTHMQLMDDGTYVVVGSRLSKSMWEHIMYNRRLITAPNTILPHTWFDVMSHNKLDYAPTTHNGAFAIAIAPSVVDGETQLIKSIEIPPASTVSVPMVNPNPCACGCAVDYM